jgi:hypothetical protein
MPIGSSGDKKRGKKKKNVYQPKRARTHTFTHTRKTNKNQKRKEIKRQIRGRKRIKTDIT